jgi:hypothetical protein
MDLNPYESPQTFDPGCRVEAQDVMRRLRIPILGLIVTSGLHLLVLAGMLGFWTLMIYHETSPRGDSDEIFCCGVVAMLLAALPAAIQLWVVRSALRCESLWACRVATLFACLPIATPGIVLGIPFGIWACVLLFLPSTAAVFDQPPQAAKSMDEL